MYRSRLKLNNGDWAIERFTGKPVRVAEVPRSRTMPDRSRSRGRRKRTYYGLVDGRYLRYDALARCLVTDGENVIQCGNPRHGVLISSGGRPSLIKWRGRKDLKVLANYPVLKQFLVWLRDGVHS